MAWKLQHNKDAKSHHGWICVTPIPIKIQLCFGNLADFIRKFKFIWKRKRLKIANLPPKKKNIFKDYLFEVAKYDVKLE